MHQRPAGLLGLVEFSKISKDNLFNTIQIVHPIPNIILDAGNPISASSGQSRLMKERRIPFSINNLVGSRFHGPHLLLKNKNLIVFLSDLLLKINEEGTGAMGKGFLNPQKAIKNLLFP